MRFEDSVPSQAQSLERLFEDDGMDTTIVQDPTFGELEFRGLGNTFIVESKVPSILTVAHDMVLEQREDGDPNEDTLGSWYAYSNVDKLLYLDGEISGGIDSNGTFIPHIRNRFQPPTSQDFQEKLTRAQQLVSLGIKPIFAPGQQGFTLRDLEGRHEQIRPVEDIRYNLHRDIGNFVLGRELQIHPDQDLGWHLAQHRLSMNAIMPSYSVEADGISLGVSKPLKDDDGRKYFVTYPSPQIQDTDMSTGAHEIQPTIFYLSNSHGVWRVLLAVGHYKDQTWYAKGMFGTENSVDAALDLQKALSTISSLEPATTSKLAREVIPENIRDRGSFFAATKIVAEARMLEAGCFAYPLQANILSSSEKDLFAPSKKPDFGAIADEYDLQNDIYGTIHAYRVPSKDGELEYLVHETTHGDKTQRWVATAQVSDANVTKLGIVERSLHLPDILTKPPVDYGDGNTYDMRRSTASRFDTFAARSIAAHRRQH